MQALCAGFEHIDAPQFHRRWNAHLAIAHTVQAVIVLYLGLSTLHDFRIPILLPGVAYNGATLEQTHTLWGASRFVAFCSVFAIISAIEHTVCWALLAPERTWLQNAIANGVNPIRWISYALSSSCMMVAILQLTGAWDVPVLVLAWILAFCTCILAIPLERTFERITFGVSFVCGLAPWIVVFMYFQHVDAPAFVTVVVFGYLAMFCTFPIIFSLRAAGRLSPHASELAFHLASLGAKTLLLATIVSGSLQPDADVFTEPPVYSRA